MRGDEDEIEVISRRVARGTELSEASDDFLVAEEPLEIRVGGVSLAVVMRTPGADAALVRGFLITERIAPTPEAIVSVRECTTVPFPEAEGNVYLATLAEGVHLDTERLRRNLFASSSCGICGKASIESAMQVSDGLPPGPEIRLETIHALIPALRKTQVVFDATGGLHAAGGFDAGGALLASFEDIGRHNAVDKVVGALAATGRRADILVVSGRVSFEIVQKALAARIPAVVAVSAPSALAVRLAAQSGITLCAFARGDRVAVYTHPERLRTN